MVEKICDYCKKPFVLKKPHARFCSRACCGHANKGKHPSALTLQKLSDSHKNPFKTCRIKSASVVCEYCKKPFKVYNYLKDKQKFCSQECRLNAIKTGMIERHYSADGLRRIAKARTGQVAWNKGKSTRVQIICEVCKKPFEVDNYRKNAKFCSLECFGVSITKHVPLNIGMPRPKVTKTKIPKSLTGIKRVKKSNIITCEICNKQFEVPDCRKDKARFCSNKCRGVWISNNRRGDEIYNYKEKIGKKCPECGKIFHVHPYRKGTSLCCSIKCYGIWQSKNRTGENSFSWIDGRSFYPYCHKFTNRLKEAVRNRDSRVCQLCSCSEKDNGEKLSVHHIHYDRENCYPDLISLCRECNSKVNKISDRKYYEVLFMNKLNEKGLLFWIKQNNK